MMKKTITGSIVLIAAIAVVMAAFAALSVEEASADTYSMNNLDEGKDDKVIWTDKYDSNAVTYFQIKPKKTGYVTFSVDFYAYTKLCDANKKVVSQGDSDGDFVYRGSDYPYQRSVSYGVKKGKTYKIMVKGYPSTTNEYGEYYGMVKWTNTKVKPSKYGKSKKKSKAIKRKKTVKGLFVAGSKKAQWYKITTNKKKIKIDLKSPKCTGFIKYKIYYKSYNKWYNTTYQTWRASLYQPVEGISNKKVKHTYYIKVTPQGKSSGAYSIKWR